MAEKKATGKRCSECLSVIPKEASICRYCGTRIEGVKCPSCASFCKSEAKKCKWCGQALGKSRGLNLAKPLEIESTFFGILLSKGSFLPQRAKFSQDKIIVSTPGFFGLTRNDEQILWEKVAGFQHKDGIIWDTIWIETRGQTAASIWGLKKEDAVRIKTLLQKLEQ